MLDCYNGEIMRDNMKKELCIDTFCAATKQYNLHSDCESQYNSEAFREALSKAGVKRSRSSVNYCYDHFRMESFLQH